MLGLLPRTFWALTPAEFADLLVAHRHRANLRGMRKAWELSMLMRVHVDSENQESVSMSNLFRSMPGVFPDDVKDLDKPSGLDDAQLAERERRRNLPRVQGRKKA